MKFYIDSEYQCHCENTTGTFRQMEHIFFDNKCNIFIEGYRFIPSGETWTRHDDIVFTGEMIAPWRPYSELDAAQRSYEQQLLKEYKIKENELNDSYQEGVNSV